MLHRVLDARPVEHLDQYLEAGGGSGLAAAREVDPTDVRGEVTSSGLRGRGGAGFPTGLKWATAAERDAATVAVNAAEGEPGTFKDRALLRRNPFRPIEGSLIAAHAVRARRIVLAIGASYRREQQRLTRALEECRAAGWMDGPDGAVAFEVALGPDAYLFGEETAMLEVIDGRHPFPRVTPPFRSTGEAPALVNNLETMANVPDIVARGSDWYREAGTSRSPGTVICTVTGDMINHGVGEFELGTPLIDVLTDVGWRLEPGRQVTAVLAGTANPLITPDHLETRVSHEHFAEVGLGMGSCGFVVFDDRRDPVAVAAGVARFLAVESCGQCEPCKRDGLAIAQHLEVLTDSQANSRTLDDLDRRLSTVADGARCGLASQQQAVVGSLLHRFPVVVSEHAYGRRPAAEPVPIAPLADLVGGRAVLDDRQYTKQPDWSHDRDDSGATPAARLPGSSVHLERGAEELEEDPGRDGTFAEDPEVLVDDAHDHLADLLGQLMRSPDPESVQELTEDLRDHVDMTRRVLAPMVSRYAGADGDDAIADATDDDRALADEIARLAGEAAGGSPASPDVDRSEAAARELIERFRRHMEQEHHMLEVLLPAMEPDERRDLARAMNDATLSEDDRSQP